MSALLASEALKLRTIRLFWVVVTVTIALSAVLGYAGVKISSDGGDPVSLVAVGAAPAQATWFLGIVLALVASAGEFQHRTIRTTLLASPRRSRVLAAKSIVASGHGALLVALGAATAVATAWATSALLGESLADSGGPSWWQVAGTIALGALWPVVAVSIGILTRSIAIAVSALLLWRFVGEGVLPVVIRVDDISSWTPTGLANTIVGAGASSLSPATAALVLAAYTIMLCAFAAVFFIHRDPT
jgi:ABC-2 type transport system permease protein